VRNRIRRRRKMSTWNYVVTAHKPTNVTHSCVGNFTSPQDLNLIIAFVLFNTTLILGFFLFFLQFLNLFIFFFQEMHSHRDSLAYSSGLTGIHNNFFDFVSAQFILLLLLLLTYFSDKFDFSVCSLS
jgi:hypothetical protein